MYLPRPQLKTTLYSLECQSNHSGIFLNHIKTSPLNYDDIYYICFYFLQAISGFVEFVWKFME